MASLLTKHRDILAAKRAPAVPSPADFARSLGFHPDPEHPYTQYLINSLPKFGDKTPRESVPGSPPSLANLPPGCPFHPRCPHVKEICKQEMPGFTQVESNHKVACWLVGEGEHGKAA